MTTASVAIAQIRHAAISHINRGSGSDEQITRVSFVVRDCILAVTHQRWSAEYVTALANSSRFAESVFNHLVNQKEI